jgi:hypothetical protein
MFCLIANSWMRLIASGSEGGDQSEVVAFSLVGQEQIGLAVFQYDSGLAARLVVAEANDHPVAFAGNAAVTDRLVAQQTAQVAADRVQTLGQCPLHVHLEQEMYPAAQIEAEIHRQGMQTGQPSR